MQRGTERKKASLILCNFQLLAEVGGNSAVFESTSEFLGEDSSMYVRYEAKFTVNKAQFSIYHDGGTSCFSTVHIRSAVLNLLNLRMSFS